MGRHGGRSDGRLEGAIDAHQGRAGARTSGRVEAGLTATLTSGHDRTGARWWEDVPQPGRAVVADPWWDEAPVPPPVVVASADGRTPAVTFAPDADPFSAGGLFAPAGPRDGEPVVVVHPAPDAGVRRPVRRSRKSSVTMSGPDTGAMRALDAVLDTGSLVRPYVPDVEMAADPVDEPAGDQADDAVALQPTARPEPFEPFEAFEQASPAPQRRARRLGGPLDRIVEAAPAVPAPPRPVTEWSAPWSRDPEIDPAQRSLFEPVARREPDGIWAAPNEQGLPSRKALRAKERAAGEVAALPGINGRELAAGSTGRRLAKSGVLAVTAMGVVAASAPNAFSALGWRLPAHPGGAGAQSALVELSSPAVLAGPSLSAPGGDLAVAMRDVTSHRRAEAAAAAKAGAVAAGAGRTLVAVARQQVQAEAARKAAIADRVSRNVLRDPRAYARMLVQQRGWAEAQFTCLNLLWNRESGWNYRAMNPSSGAYGIPQSLPGSKMASVASDWRTNPATQIKWGLNYIAERYGTPCGAWAHSESVGWY